MTLIPRLLLSVAAASIPALLYTLVVWWLDRYEREPGRLILVAFVWGAIPAVLLSVFLEGVLGQTLVPVGPGLLQEVATGSLLAPTIEEIAKGLAIFLLFVLAGAEFDSVLDGIVYGAVIGFGFAMTENFLYFFDVLGRDTLPQWRAIVALRALLFGFSHAFYTAVIGAGFGLAATLRGESRQLQWSMVGTGLILAIAFHAVHNLGITLSATSPLALAITILTDWGGLGLLLVIVMLAWQQERTWISAELRSEVGFTLTPAEYADAAAYGRRVQIWVEAVRSGGWRAARQRSAFHRLITELAFLKYRQRRTGDTSLLRNRIAQTRAEILAARRRGKPLQVPNYD